MDFVNHMLFAFLALFPILNPPAMSPIFLQLTAGVKDAERHHLARMIGLYTFIMLTALLFAGHWLLKLLGISIPVIAIAGGLLLFHTAWGMLGKKPKLSEAEQQAMPQVTPDQAFYPLPLPGTAGPGSSAVTLTLVPPGPIWALDSLTELLAVVAGIALAGLNVFLFYRFSEVFMRRLGKTGAATISQVSAFVLLAIGVQIVWSGIKGLLQTL